MMPQSGKLLNIVKGTLTFLPPLNAWRARHAGTGGTDSPFYCWSVWRRHLQGLLQFGFTPSGARIAELGPGDTIGVGLAALLSGAEQYTGLDSVPFAQRFDPAPFFDELCRILMNETEPRTVPDNGAMEARSRILAIRTQLQSVIDRSQIIQYNAPWHP